MAKKMRAVQVPCAGGALELVERDIPESQPGWVRIKVDACGVCHSDSLVKEGHWPGIQYPRVPGHEVIGVVDAAESPAGPAPMMMTSCMGSLDDDLRRLPLERFTKPGGDLVRLKLRGGRSAPVVEELD